MFFRKSSNITYVRGRCVFGDTVCFNRIADMLKNSYICHIHVSGYVSFTFEILRREFSISFATLKASLI